MCLPILLCRLCDQSGKILNAYDRNAIRFNELTTPETRERGRSFCLGRSVELSTVVISVEGYVAVSLDGRNLSAPIPFRIIQRIWIDAPKDADIEFTVNNFICQAIFASALNLKIGIYIETLVRSRVELDPCDEQSGMLSCRHKTIDAVKMLSRTCLLYGISHIKAEESAYNALSDGIKRVYTDADDMKEYGGNGILSPSEVSYYNLYVNGVLQPKVDYIMTRGRLEFVTANLPAKGETILLRYVTYKSREKVFVTDYQYFATSDGQKRVYTNADEIREYGDHGIPGPDEVSYYNLFINGVLQPRENYRVEKGQLELKTCDVPQKGQAVILESVIIKDSCGRFFRVEVYQYNVHSDAQRIYDSGDELNYGDGILGSCQSSYQNLFINAVNQPKVDYQTTDGCLVLLTVDLPLKETPVSMQSIVVQDNATPWICYGCWC